MPGRSYRALVVATVLLLAASSATVAFDLVDDEPSTKAGGPVDRDKEDADEDRGGDDPAGLEVLDRGDGPRQALRFRPEVGDAVRQAVVTTIALDLTVDGEAVEAQPLPATRVVVEYLVDRVDDDGRAHYSLTFVEVRAAPGSGLDEDTTAHFEAATSALEGLQGTGTIDAQGDNQELSLDSGGVDNPVVKAFLDSFASQVNELGTPLPGQPVGVGARWRVKRTATLLGITTDFTTTFTLRSLDGDSFEVGIVRTGSGRPGGAAIPGLPAGTDATLERLASRGEGRLAGDLRRPIAQDGSIDGTATIDFTIVAGLDTSELRQEVTVGFEVSSD